ncbi:MAG: DUF2007 domain-containing protein [Luteimonas sp.]|nr:DUF2007 domain-containing protein [Luteimonas sp.]
MRQVFSSARLENVEAVAKLLADEGIEVRIENGRTFRSSIRGNFSYRDGEGGGAKPAVWVVRSDDQPRARQLLREVGLLDAAPSSANSFLPSTGHAARAASPKRRNRMRFGLLVLVAIVIAIALNPLRDPGGWDLPAPRPAAQVPAALDPALLPVLTSAGGAHYSDPARRWPRCWRRANWRSHRERRYACRSTALIRARRRWPPCCATPGST